MEKKEYNGWYNYETWLIKLWMDNDEGNYNYWLDRVRDYVRGGLEDEKDKEKAYQALADEIKEQHEEYIEQNLKEQSGFMADLVNAAISEVNWYEIAEHMINDEID